MSALYAAWATNIISSGYAKTSLVDNVMLSTFFMSQFLLEVYNKYN